MRRWRFLSLSALVLTAGGLMSQSSGVALASAPIHFSFADTFPDTLCGIPVTGTDRGVVSVHAVNSSPNATKYTSSVTTTYTAANGKSITNSQSGTTSETVTTNPDGTITVIDVVKGLAERLSVQGGGTVSIDAGIVTITTLLDLSTTPPTVLSSSVSVAAGPHPDAGGSVFCTVVTQALT